MDARESAKMSSRDTNPLSHTMEQKRPSVANEMQKVAAIQVGDHEAQVVFSVKRWSDTWICLLWRQINALTVEQVRALARDSII